MRKNQKSWPPVNSKRGIMGRSNLRHSFTHWTRNKMTPCLSQMIVAIILTVKNKISRYKQPPCISSKIIRSISSKIIIEIQNKHTISNGRTCCCTSCCKINRQSRTYWRLMLLKNQKFRMSRVVRFVVGKGPLCGVLTLRRRERQSKPKCKNYLDETTRPRYPLPTTICYIEYIVIQQRQSPIWWQRGFTN